MNLYNSMDSLWTIIFFHLAILHIQFSTIAFLNNCWDDVAYLQRKYNILAHKKDKIKVLFWSTEFSQFMAHYGHDLVES